MPSPRISHPRPPSQNIFCEIHKPPGGIDEVKCTNLRTGNEFSRTRESLAGKGLLINSDLCEGSLQRLRWTTEWTISRQCTKSAVSLFHCDVLFIIDSQIMNQSSKVCIGR